VPTVPSSYPTIYLNGKVNGEANPAFRRSTDYGQTWTKVADDPAGIAGTCSTSPPNNQPIPP
jgi:hypothetical protein